MDATKIKNQTHSRIDLKLAMGVLFKRIAEPKTDECSTIITIDCAKHRLAELEAEFANLNGDFEEEIKVFHGQIRERIELIKNENEQAALINLLEDTDGETEINKLSIEIRHSASQILAE